MSLWNTHRTKCPHLGSITMQMLWKALVCMTTLDMNLCYRVWDFVKFIAIIDCVALRWTVLGRQCKFLYIFNFWCLMEHEVTWYGRLSSGIISVLECHTLFILMMRLGKIYVLNFSCYWNQSWYHTRSVLRRSCNLIVKWKRLKTPDVQPFFLQIFKICEI